MDVTPDTDVEGRVPTACWHRLDLMSRRGQSRVTPSGPRMICDKRYECSSHLRLHTSRPDVCGKVLRLMINCRGKLPNVPSPDVRLFDDIPLTDRRCKRSFWELVSGWYGARDVLRIGITGEFSISRLIRSFSVRSTVLKYLFLSPLVQLISWS